MQLYFDFNKMSLFRFTFKRNRTFLVSYIRQVYSESSKGAIPAVITNKVTSAVNYFDGLLGITEVRQAQAIVTEAENEFMRSRGNVQESRTQLVRLQEQLRDLRIKLDRIAREDERYLELATEEHRLLIEEKKVKYDLERFVTSERDQFTALSGAVRNAHEKERSRAERTKYWSIIGSACGAVLGILGSTLLNIKRMQQIKLTVEENNRIFMTKTFEELKTIIGPGNETTTPSEHHGAQPMTSEEFKISLDKLYMKIEEIFISNCTLRNELKLLIEQLRFKFSDKENTPVLDLESDLLTDYIWSKPGVAFTLLAGISYGIWYILYGT